MAIKTDKQIEHISTNWDNLGHTETIGSALDQLNALQAESSEAWARYQQIQSKIAETQAVLVENIRIQQLEIANSSRTHPEVDSLTADISHCRFKDSIASSDAISLQQANTRLQNELMATKKELLKYRVELAFVKGPNYTPHDCQ